MKSRAIIETTSQSYGVSLITYLYQCYLPPTQDTCSLQSKTSKKKAV